MLRRHHKQNAIVARLYNTTAATAQSVPVEESYSTATLEFQTFLLVFTSRFGAFRDARAAKDQYYDEAYECM